MFFFSLSPPQMTEQRKNKQRLGFLGPPQPNHHIPAHWQAKRSNRTEWHATRPCARSRKQIEMQTHTHTQTPAWRTIHVLRVHSQLLMSECERPASDIVPFQWHNRCLMGYKLCLMCSLGPEEHRLTHPRTEELVSVNDQPGVAHICQCSVSVPNRDWGKC